MASGSSEPEFLEALPGEDPANDSRFVRGHVTAICKDQRDQIIRRTLGVYLPVGELESSLQTQEYKQKVANFFDTKGYQPLWVGPWTSGPFTDAINPVKMPYHVMVDVRRSTAPRQGEDTTILVRGRLKNLDFYVWNREAFTEVVRKKIDLNNYEILSIGAIGIGTYVSYLHPLTPTVDE